MQPIVHKLVHRGAGGFANLTLASGERILISIAPSGLRIHRLHFGGLLPRRRLHAAGASELAGTINVLGRDLARLPALPERAAMEAFLVTATQTIADPGVYRRGPVGEDGLPVTPLVLLTRVALAEAGAAALARRLSRAAATP
jgi:hypothetical protein